MRSLPSVPESRAGWLGRQDFAHRGLHGPGVPENSRAAFVAAIERRLGIECDVQCSRDGVALVFHDWTLDRLTGESGDVRARDAADVRRIALSGCDESIPELAEVLDLVDGRVPLLVEVKSRREIAVEPICLSVRRGLEDYRGEVGVMSFDPRVGRWFARNAPDIVRGLVVTEEGTGAQWHGLWHDLRRHLALRMACPDFLAYDVRDLPSRFASAQRRRGMALATWTVRTEENLELARRHADAAIAEGPRMTALRGTAR